MRELIDFDKNPDKMVDQSLVQRKINTNKNSSGRFAFVDRWRGIFDEHKDVYLCIDCCLQYRVKTDEKEI